MQLRMCRVLVLVHVQQCPLHTRPLSRHFADSWRKSRRQFRPPSHSPTEPLASQAHSTSICYLFSESSDFTFASVSPLSLCICCISVANTWHHSIDLGKPCTIHQVHSVYTRHLDTQKMSFFGFDPTIPRGRGHPDKAPGFATAPDPFAGISQHHATGDDDDDDA